MKKEQLIDSNAEGLIAVMTTLSETNRQIAVIHNKLFGDEREVDDDEEYVEAQRYIQAAIRQIGYILGNNIAEKFY